SDAACCRFDELDRERLVDSWRRATRGPAFCLGALAVAVLIVSAVSGGLPTMRSVVLPLNWPDAGRIATVAEGGASLAMRAGPPTRWVRQWRSESKTIQGVATYVWRRSEPGFLNAVVSGNFFSLIGVEAEAGTVWNGHEANPCADCAVLTHSFAISRYGRAPNAICRSMVLDGRRYRVMGVLPRDFWFLSRRIAVWTPATPAQESNPLRRTGVAIRMAPEVSPHIAEQELLSIVRHHEMLGWDTVITVSPVQQRVRSVLFSFGLGLMLAAAIVLAGVRLRIPLFSVDAPRLCWRLAPFFVV